MPKATAASRILLKLLTGDRFKQRLWLHTKPLLIKGAPALLTDLKADVYSTTERTLAVEELLLSNIASMEASMTLQGDEEEQDPTVYLWLLYFTAQHFYYRRDFERALRFIDQAIEHTPTVVDLYVLKAKIFKRAGDARRASTLYEEARRLDLADRYLNAVSSRYLLRVDQIEKAEETMALFSREQGEERGLNVHDMQCMWFEVESGLAHLRLGNLRMALKNFNFIERHFD